MRGTSPGYGQILELVTLGGWEVVALTVLTVLYAPERIPLDLGDRSLAQATNQQVDGGPGVASAIQLLRTRQGLSARELSERAGLSPSYVGKVESGQIEPSLRAFAHIAVGLHMTPQEVWFCVLNESIRPLHKTVTPSGYTVEQQFEEGE